LKIRFQAQQQEAHMSALSLGQRIWSPIEAAVEWCRERLGLEGLAQLEYCGEQEVQHIAEDIGVSRSELLRLASSDAGAADLLLDRMAALDLDRGEVTRVMPRTFRDLQRVCTLCTSHRTCARDLARRPIDPRWKDYCPNAATLNALDAMPWAARNEW
jgi:hypothetical protein